MSRGNLLLRLYCEVKGCAKTVADVTESPRGLLLRVFDNERNDYAEMPLRLDPNRTIVAYCKKHGPRSLSPSALADKIRLAQETSRPQKMTVPKYLH